MRDQRKWAGWMVLEDMEKAYQREVSQKRESTPPAVATITSGFDREVLRLTAADVKFLTDCGVKIE